ncbi:MFS transporter [Xenorhabdus sp. SF857]|uniref:MFS transporter n=1 Tax=Xenorhabdus bakwenae TaxID=3026967 RepID=UPI002558122C|nr:MFS transporter [Xenorhabdus sp. SF857]WFQ79046.1 MFS transporter [Xenorhabdus sp. SF857]
MFTLLSGSRGIIFYGLITSAARMLAGATSTVYLMSSGMTIADISWLKSIQAAVILFADVPFGYLADKFGRGNTVKISILFSAIWLSMTAVGEHKSVFMIAEVFNAFSIALFSGAFNALLLETCKKETEYINFEKIIGHFYKWQFILMALFSFIGAIVFPPDSKKTWWIAAIVVTSIMLLFNYVIPVNEEAKSNKKEILNKNLIWAIKNIFSSKISLPIFILCISVSLCFQISIQFWQPMIAGENLYNIPGEYYGIVFVLILLSQSLASYIAQQIKAKISNLLLISIMMMVSFVITFICYKELSKYFIILLICSDFFLMKLITIHTLSIFLQEQSDNQWATSESFVSSMTRIFLLLILAGLGSIGPGLDIKFIFFSLIIMSVIYVIIISVLSCLSLKEKTFSKKDA